MIAVLDYGAGNVTSVRRAVERLGHRCLVTADPGQVAGADRVIVPGVGHFAALAALMAGGLGAALTARVADGAPVLGICLGMQWLFEASDEAPEARGLGLFPGRCRPLPGAVKSPHMGWDQLLIGTAGAGGDAAGAGGRLLRGVPSGSWVYFAHSYAAPVVAGTTASCEYGAPHSAAVERGNAFGVQFHPEKSGAVGLSVLGNFCSC